MGKYLYHVAATESQESILEKGLLAPIEILCLIDEGRLPQSSLGASSNKNPSNFPRHISLLEDFEEIEKVIQQICISRTGCDTDPTFKPVVYLINSEIREHEGFIDSVETRKINSNAYNSEALYPGKIPTEFIEKQD